jgi:hypothetical protein
MPAGSSEPALGFPNSESLLHGVTVLGSRTPDDVTVLAGTGGQRATAGEVRRFVAREQARIARERRNAPGAGR